MPAYGTAATGLPYQHAREMLTRARYSKNDWGRPSVSLQSNRSNLGSVVVSSKSCTDCLHRVKDGFLGRSFVETMMWRMKLLRKGKDELVPPPFKRCCLSCSTLLTRRKLRRVSLQSSLSCTTAYERLYCNFTLTNWRERAHIRQSELTSASEANESEAT